MNEHIKYFILALVIIFFFNSKSLCQDIKSPYFNSSPLGNGDLETSVNGYGLPIKFYRSNNASGYDGEYEINLLLSDFFWGGNFLDPTS